MSLIKKMQKGALAGIGTLALIGCAIEKQPDRAEVSKPYQENQPIRVAYESSPIKSTYLARITMDGRLRTIAGLLSGDIKMQKIDNGVIAEGSYSQFSKPEYFDKALKLCDLDNDGKVTNEETRKILDYFERKAQRKDETIKGANSLESNSIKGAKELK